MKGNRHTEPQRGVSERNRRIAAALGAEMGSLSRSITRRSDQNCKIILQILILQFCRQLVKKVQNDFFDKLRPAPWSRSFAMGGCPQAYTTFAVFHREIKANLAIPIILLEQGSFRRKETCQWQVSGGAIRGLEKDQNTKEKTCPIEQVLCWR